MILDFGFWIAVVRLKDRIRQGLEARGLPVPEDIRLRPATTDAPPEKPAEGGSLPVGASS